MTVSLPGLDVAAEPVTTEGRINRNVFPLARFGAKYALLPKGIEPDLRSRIEQALVPIKIAPASWFRAAIGSAPPSPERRKILASYTETEIWKCLGDRCEGCPGNEITGCVLSNSVGGGIGTVGLIHPCLYGEGKCPRGGIGDLAEWTENFVFGVAFYKSGQPKNSAVYRKGRKASSEWLANTSRSVNLLLGACPGPYGAESLKFLLSLDAITLPNPAVMRCGQTYLEELRELPKRCSPLAGSLREDWRGYEKNQLRPNAEILRCDPFCMKMLCRQKDTGTVFTRFSGKPTLLLGDGACDGESPKLRGIFTREALPRAIREKLELGTCLPPLEKGSSLPSAESNTSGLGDGPGVLLVE